MIFTCNTVEQQDHAGNLTMIGVEWCEAHPFLEMMMLKAGIFLVVAGPLYALVAVCGGFAGHALMGIAVAVSGGALVWYAREGMGATPRSMLFFRDGSISTPLGMACLTNKGIWKVRHGEVANIEAEQVGASKEDEMMIYTHGVRMIMRRGKVNHIAKYLDPDQAHEVAVSLTNALASLRNDMGARQGPREVEILIN